MIDLNYIGINNPTAQESYYFYFEADNFNRIVFENFSFKTTDGSGYDWGAIIGFGDYRVFSDGERIRFDVQTPYTDIFNDLEFATVEFTETKLIINGTEYPCTPRDLSKWVHMYLFNSYNRTNQVKEGTIGTVSYYYNNTLSEKFVPCIDDNNLLCFRKEDEGGIVLQYVYPNNQTYFYSGSVASTIIVDSDIKAVPASGGTINVTVNSDTPWSATSTGSWYTMSQTAGTENDTAITITVPSTTSTTQSEDTITFTNENGDTAQLTIKQRKYSVGGIHLLNIGDTELDTLMIGDQEVELIYMGEEVVYEKGQGPTPTPTPTQPQAAFLWTNDGEIHVISEVEGELVFPTLSNGVDYYMVNTTDDLDEITTEKAIFGLVDEDDGFYLDIYKKIDGWKILYNSGNGEVEESCGLAIGETISIQDFGFEFEVIENGFVFNFTNNIFENIGFCEIYGENDGDEIEQNNVRFVYVDDGENTPYWDAVGCEYVCKACFEMVNGNIGERTVNKSDCPYLVNDRGYGVIFYVSYWGGGNEQIALMNVTDDYYGKALYLNANKSIKFGDTTINQGTVNASVGNYYVSNKKNSTEEWIEILPSNGNSRLTISNLY